MSNGIGELFVERAQAFMRAAVAEFGSQRAAARALDVPISTFRANYLGEVAQPNIRTVARLATGYVNQPGGVRHELRGLTDLMAGLDPGAARTAAEQLAADPETRRGAATYFNDVWHGEQRRREEQGAPPLRRFSP